MAAAWSAHRLSICDPGAVIELATGPRHLGQARGSEGAYGYESCSDNGYLDRFNVSKLLCRRELLQCRSRIWSLSSRCSPRTSLSNKRRLSQLGSVESTSYASTNFTTPARLSNVKE
jgi:hypothetical protein